MRLKQYINEGIEDKGILKAVFIVGHPGSGKSYVLSKIKSGQIEPRVVNTDKVFPLYSKDEWDKWVDIKTKVKTINKNQLANYINSMLPLAVDGTGTEPSVILRRVGILESFGYDVGMVFINTSLETALERAGKRDRPVDPDFIKRVYKRIQDAKQFYRSKFSDWQEIQNDKGELTEKVIIDAFKHMTSFYNSPMVNPVGKEIIQKMKENKWKYLSPNIKDIKEIQNMMSAWYRM